MTDGEYRILFMVRRPYFDAIVAGTKTFELRRDSQRWYSMGCEALRAGKKGRLAIAVFMCGRQRVHRRRIVDVRWIENAEVALGRAPTQEELEFLGDGEVILFEIGEVVL